MCASGERVVNSIEETSSNLVKTVNRFKMLWWKKKKERNGSPCGLPALKKKKWGLRPVWVAYCTPLISSRLLSSQLIRSFTASVVSAAV